VVKECFTTPSWSCAPIVSGLADPVQARVLFLEHVRLHARTPANSEEVRLGPETWHGGHLRDFRLPEFASYLTLRRSISYKREYIAWCQ
jgi:hypothetical protein